MTIFDNAHALPCVPKPLYRDKEKQSVRKQGQAKCIDWTNSPFSIAAAHTSVPRKRISYFRGVLPTFHFPFSAPHADIHTCLESLSKQYLSPSVSLCTKALGLFMKEGPKTLVLFSPFLAPVISLAHPSRELIRSFDLAARNCAVPVNPAVCLVAPRLAMLVLRRVWFDTYSKAASNKQTEKGSRC
jgi:hypothetical protein